MANHESGKRTISGTIRALFRRALPVEGNETLAEHVERGGPATLEEHRAFQARCREKAERLLRRRGRLDEDTDSEGSDTLSRLRVARANQELLRLAADGIDD